MGGHQIFGGSFLFGYAHAYLFFLQSASHVSQEYGEGD